MLDIVTVLTQEKQMTAFARNSNHPWVFLISILTIITPRSLPAADLQNKPGTQWSPHLQWTLENPTWTGNPFDVEAIAEFTHQASGEIRRTQMFYLGHKTWAFRFTGTKPGSWTFVTSSTDPDLTDHRGQATIKTNPHSNAHGFLKKFDNKWGWEGTENAFVPQLAMWDYIADGNSPKVFLNNPSLIEDKIKQFISGHGFNGFHVSVIAGRWFDINGSEQVHPKLTDPDPRTFEALEQLIIKTHQAGGMVHIWPWGDHQRSQTPRNLRGGINGAIDQRLQRYIAARLGPIPGWSMGYGFDLDEWVKAPQVRVWRDSLHKLMGWHHFLGGRPEGPNHGTDHKVDAPWNKGLDYSSYEHHRPDYQVYLAALLATKGMPVMSEDRFRVRKNKYPEKDYTEELVRRGLYHSTLAGGIANIWGIDPSLSPSGVFSNKHWIKTYSTFFHHNNRFLKDMTSGDPKLSINPNTHVLLSKETHSLVAYRESTDTIHIDLANLPASQPVIAVDTRKPYREIDFGKLAAKAQTIKLPAKSDWALAVGYFEGTLNHRLQNASANLSFTEIWQGPKLNGGHGVMWADVDDDGLPDLYLPLIIAETLPDLFMHNQGNGVFTEQGKERGISDSDGGSHGAAWCDLDNDGDYDLINGTTFDDGSGIQNDIFRNDGHGKFTEMKPSKLESRGEATRAFIAFDINRDGRLDLFGVTNYQGSNDPPKEKNEVYLNTGDFKFSPITSGGLYNAPAGQGATDTDYDGDGDVDVLAANRTGPVNIIQNDGEGNFTLIDPSTIGIRHRAEDGVTTADVDNDGDLDLLLAGSSGQAYLYINDGDGTFTHAKSFSDIKGYMGGFADFDNDGDVDLCFAGDNKVYLNDGEGKFTSGPALILSGRNDPRGIAFADMDNDGDMDFAVADKRANRNYILRNNLTGGGNWLKVKLIAPNGQAGVFGAKTSVYANGKLLGMRESQSNCGYLGQNDPVLHFGLGKTTRVEVIVRFIDGTETKKTGVQANQILLISGTN